MITELGYGVFLLYSVLTYIGVVFIFFCLPEMKGRSIESMDDLFQRPLWTMWKHAYPAEEEKVRSDVQKSEQLGMIESAATKKSLSEHIENMS